MDIKNVELRQVNDNDKLTFKDLTEEMQDEIKNYSDYNNGEFAEDLQKSIIRVQLTDVNGKIFEGTIDMLAGFLADGKTTLFLGQLENIYE